MAGDAERRSSRRSDQEHALALFSVMWALAAVWHLLGNPGGSPAWAQLILAAGVGAVLMQPGAPVPFAILAIGGLATMWEEAPVLGNHWLLAGFVHLAILLSVAVGWMRGRLHEATDLANRLLPVVRLSLLGFYSFAAFAKLNAGFFDRSVSCAVFYFRESTDSVGLTGLQLGGAAWLEHAVIVGTAVIELSVPVLLVIRRTRRVGVLLALVFHGILAIDHSHEFFDFSALLFAMFLLFLPAGGGAWLAERVGSVRARLALRDEDLPHRLHVVAAVGPTAVAALVALDVFTLAGARTTGWWPWQLYAIATVVLVGRYLHQERRTADVRLLPHHPVFLLVPLLVVANGITPYVELKTGYGWNMYANLRTVDGESNHFIVRRTLPLTDEQADVVEIIDTNSAALGQYAATEYGLTWRQLRTFLADHPDRRIVYRRGGEVVSLQRADDDPELVEPVPEWREKIQLFRAIDLTEPERCVPTWGPAR